MRLLTLIPIAFAISFNVNGKTVFDVDHDRLVEVARNALRTHDQTLTDAELPAFSVFIICNRTENECTAMVTLELRSQDHVIVKDTRCSTKTTIDSMTVMVSSDGRTLVRDGIKQVNRTRIGDCEVLGGV